MNCKNCEKEIVEAETVTGYIHTDGWVKCLDKPALAEPEDN